MALSPHNLPTELTTQRLSLRRYRVEDVGVYWRMLREEVEHLREFMPAFLMNARDEGEIAAWFERQHAEWEGLTLFIFGVWEKTTGDYIGESYLANPDWDVPRIEVGYFLRKKYTGRGFATEATNAVIDFAFAHLKVIRVDLRCNAENTASMRVAQRCGFMQEGRIRQAHRRKDGTLVDCLWFGLLFSEWLERKSALSRS